MANFIDWRKRNVSDGNGAIGLARTCERVRRLRQADVLDVNVSMYYTYVIEPRTTTSRRHTLCTMLVSTDIQTKIEITRCLACEGMSGVYEAGLSIADS